MSLAHRREASPARSVREVDAIWDGPSPAQRRLDVTYLIPHHNLTGGMKIHLEHLRRLRARGHRVRALARGAGTRVLPPWSDVEVDEQVMLPRGARLGDWRGRTDVIVCGWFQGLPDLVDAVAPVLYFEQGHAWLFDDAPPTPEGARVAADFEAALRLPIPVAAVSPHVAERLAARFDRRVGVVVNGIDLLRFHPAPRPPGHRALLVGHPELAFKGFATALAALQRARARVPDLEVTWVSQVGVALPGAPFPFRNVVSPPQDELPGIYRAHDVYLCASRYESFSLPPLEAMACGVPVVTTRCGGVTTYAVPGWNCAMAPVGDAAALADAVADVLRDPAAARAMAARGRRTAERFTWDAAIDALEDALLRTCRLAA